LLPQNSGAATSTAPGSFPSRTFVAISHAEVELTRTELSAAPITVRAPRLKRGGRRVSRVSIFGR
jgi:hypothetical protein